MKLIINDEVLDCEKNHLQRRPAQVPSSYLKTELLLVKTQFLDREMVMCLNNSLFNYVFDQFDLI